MRPDAGPGGFATEVEIFETLGRLSVADTEDGTVHVWDLNEDALFTTYRFDSPPRLYRPLSRQVTAVVAAQADRTDVFAVGVRVWDHVDHFHVYTNDRILGVDEALAMSGGASRVVVSGGWINVFDDATGSGTALLERSIGDLRSDIERSRAPIFRHLSGETHEGVAAHAQGHFFVTRAEGALLALPPGTDAVEDAIAVPETCAARTGAATGPYALFGCATDLLLATWDGEDETFSYQRVALPDGTGAVTRLLAEHDLPVFLGSAGAQGVLFVDAEAGTAARVDVDSPIVDMHIDRDATGLAVLLEDGRLLVLDPVTGAELAVGRVLADSADVGTVTTGDGRVYVSDPDGGVVHELELPSLVPLRELAIGGRPGSMVVTALWPGGEPVMH